MNVYVNKEHILTVAGQDLEIKIVMINGNSSVTQCINLKSKNRIIKELLDDQIKFIALQNKGEK